MTAGRETSGRPRPGRASRGEGGTAVEAPDVVVVGAGPAGSTTAGLLAAGGWDVLVLERHRFPRPKACGECLNPGAVAVLDRLGLLEAVRALEPARIGGWDVHTGGGARASGRFGPEVEPGLALPRALLDAALLDEARRRGARVEEGVRVTGVEAGAPGRGPRVAAERADRRPVRYVPSLVVGADGLRSVVARSVGAVLRKPQLRKASLTFRVRGGGLPADRGRLHLSGLGTVGIAPLGPTGGGSPRPGKGDGDAAPPPGPGTDAGTTATDAGRQWNVTVVAASRDASRLFAGPPAGVLARALERAAPDWEGPMELAGGPWGSGPFDWPSRPVPAPGVVLVGDAAGYFDPLTGQGLYRAFRSAELAAAAIDRTLRNGGESWTSLAVAGRRIRRIFAPGRRVQRAIEVVVSRRPLREMAVRRLGSAPSVLDALIRVTGDARPVASLARPGLVFRLAVPGGRDAGDPAGPAAPGEPDA